MKQVAAVVGALITVYAVVALIDAVVKDLQDPTKANTRRVLRRAAAFASDLVSFPR